MPFVPRSSTFKSALWRPAMFFFAVAQIMLAFAPLAEARRGSDSAAHVEDAGISLHHAHNEAECTACIARVLLATSAPAGRETLAITVVKASNPGATSNALTSVGIASSRSRAPPAVRA